MTDEETPRREKGPIRQDLEALAISLLHVAVPVGLIYHALICAHYEQWTRLVVGLVLFPLGVVNGWVEALNLFDGAVRDSAL